MDEKFEVVISGISGRFPECDDVSSYFNKLYNQENVITYDDRKWPVNYKYKFGEDPVPLGTGKYTDIQKFDARAFACSTMLAKCTDIINRKVLEPSFEAVLDAGINPVSLMGANIGCYMSSTINEVESIKIFSRAGDKMYIVGGSKAMLSNRVSFALNLTGPSYTYYNGVFGGFEALTAAYQSIREGRIEAALVGGASSIIDPKLSLNFQRMGYLSPDGLARTFDAGANGYGRSEGAVVLFLQRAQDAKRNYANLRFSDCYYFGMNPQTLIGYDENMIETSLKEIYAQNGNVNPCDISFLEMDACGVKRLDQIESEAVSRVFCNNRKNPLLIGSVKSQCGHTEGASAYISILKALFALETEIIAPNMHFTKPNPNIKPIIEGKLKVVDEKTKLTGPLVGVNALSISGLTGHVVLEQNRKVKSNDDDDNSDKLARLVLLCGRTENGMKEVIEKVEAMPLNKEFIVMTNDIFRTPIMTHFYRGFTIVPPVPQPTNAIDTNGGENRPIWFVFSGMGSQWNGMGRELLSIPIFAQSIDRCDRVLRPKGLDIYHILTSDDVTLFDDIINAFVGIIAVQVGLIDILKQLDIIPDGIIGHSVGENACAYADGCLTLEQSVLASYARGMASKEAETIKGMMAAIGIGYNQVKNSLPKGIEIACHNSADNCTLTGPADLVNEYVTKLQSEGVFARAVNVSNIAYHSKHIAPAAPFLLKRLSEVIPEPKARSNKWISTSVPEAEWSCSLAETCSAEYLTNNLVSPVLFEEGCKHIPENAVVIEIAPHGLLQAILKRSLNKSHSNIPLTLRSKTSNAVNFLLAAIGKLYIAGCHPHVNALYPKIEYPVPRGTPSNNILATWDHSESFHDIGPLKDKPLSEEVFEVKLNEGSVFSYLKSHRIKNQPVIPSSLFLYLTWHILSVMKNINMMDMDLIFENIKVHRDLHITLEKPRAIVIMIQYGTGNFEILLRKNKKNNKDVSVIMTGTIQIPYEKIGNVIEESNMPRVMKKIDGQAFYDYLENIGYTLDNQFSNVEEIILSDTSRDGLAKISWNKNWICFLDSLMKIYTYCDFKRTDLLFPNRIRKIEISSSMFNALDVGAEILCYVDYVTKQIRCNGLRMDGFVHGRSSLSGYLNSECTRFKIQRLEFISQDNPCRKDKKTFLEYCLQLAVQSVIPSQNYFSSEFKIVNLTDDLKNDLNTILEGNTELKRNFKVLKSIKDVDPLENLIVVTSNLKIVEESVLHLNFRQNILLLVISSLADYQSTNKFIKLTEQSFAGIRISMYKSILVGIHNKNLPIVINASDKKITTVMKYLNVPQSQPVFLIRKIIEVDDMSVILAKENIFSNARFIFLMDDNAPEFSFNDPLYFKQIQRNLPVNILKNGEWGFYQRIKSSRKEIFCERTDYSELKMKSTDLKFFGLVRKITDKDDNDQLPITYHVEYSGINTSGQHIMGLGKCCVDAANHDPDPFFTWLVPENWNLEGASTVPLTYLQVYKALFFMGVELEHAHTASVFINSDKLSFKEACIRLCVHFNINVFVTVSDEHESDNLLKQFPSLDKSRLLIYDQCKYEVQLLTITKGDGVNVVISTNGTSEHAEASTNCVSKLGYYVHVGDIEDLDSKIGLYVFLKSISFNRIPNNYSYFANLPVEMKKSLSAMMEAGIIEGAVKPLSRHSSNQTNMKDCLVKQNFEFQPKLYGNNRALKLKLKFDGNRSYVLFGGMSEADLLCDLLEWLISRGALKFIVSVDEYCIPADLSKRINQLTNRNLNCTILILPNCCDSVDKAYNLFTNAINIAPLESVFFASPLLSKENIESVDIASRQFPPTNFVSFFCNGLIATEIRTRDDLPATFIYYSEKIRSFSDVSQQIEKILDENQKYLYELVDRNIEEKELMKAVLTQHLSIDFERLERIGERARENLIFSEVVTKSKKYSETKGVYPLFVIPALDSDSMNDFLSNLMSPTFCASFVENSCSATDNARLLLKELKSIQPKGPVTIIGETWSGCVSIELASFLQSENRSVKLFLIEGSPFTWRNHIQTLGDIESKSFDRNLMQAMFKIPFQKYLQNNSNPFEVINQYLKELNVMNASELLYIEKAIKGIRNKLIANLNYTQPAERLKHIVLFKQNMLESYTEKYCMSDEIHLFNDGKYSDFLRNKIITKIINEKVHFSWWR